MKICSFPNCNNFVFSHHYCYKHRYIVYKEQSWLKGTQIGLKGRNSLKRSKIPLKKVPIKKVSNKRIIQNKQYKKICNEIDQELIQQDKFDCIFCNIPLKQEYKAIKDIENPNFIDHHHIKGKIGKNYLDKKYIFPAHRKCHINDYHQATVKHLLSMFWYQNFIQRLKYICLYSYNKELNRLLKYNKMKT